MKDFQTQLKHLPYYIQVRNGGGKWQQLSLSSKNYIHHSICSYNHFGNSEWEKLSALYMVSSYIKYIRKKGCTEMEFRVPIILPLADNLVMFIIRPARKACKTVKLLRWSNSKHSTDVMTSSVAITLICLLSWILQFCWWQNDLNYNLLII